MPLPVAPELDISDSVVRSPAVHMFEYAIENVAYDDGSGERPVRRAGEGITEGTRLGLFTCVETLFRGR